MLRAALLPATALMASLAAPATPVLAETPRIPLVIRLEPQAAKELAAAGEMITISAHFYGEAKPDSTIEPDEMGEITLGLEEFTTAPRDVTVDAGASLAVAPVDQVAVPMLNVNIWTARYSDANNLLECTPVDGAVADLAGKTQQISCKLLPPGEGDAGVPPADCAPPPPPARAGAARQPFGGHRMAGRAPLAHRICAFSPPRKRGSLRKTANEQHERTRNTGPPDRL